MYEKVIELIEKNESWRKSCLNMIASENTASPAVRSAVASDFGHRYAEGLLGGRDAEGLQIFERFYQGTKFFDDIESIAMKLTEELFSAEHVNLVPISGAVANLVAYSALAKYGDSISGLSIMCGGHISHTHISAAGVMGLKDFPYPFDNKEMNIDVDGAKKIVREKRPKLMILGGSLFLFPHPVRELREIADEIDAYIMYDGAHVSGLIAGGQFQNPLKEGVDVFTSSTHKTFPGPQGGMVMCKSYLKEKVDNAAFPGMMSNHHLHHVAGYAIAAAEMKKFGKAYAGQIVKNAKALAQALNERGFDVLCEHKGFTESHQVVMDVSKIGHASVIAQDFENANMIVNKNLLPWDSLLRTKDPSGIRIGVQEITRFGMKEGEMEEIAEFMKKVAIDGSKTENIKNEVIELKKNHAEIGFSF
ncbi:serine hydroxymethyltransferase [archaeon]|nr:serine hydroxymethyltransferase [archaeon]